ncbi:tetratricopeptide repeat protein [bacterium]|nr:tetratricopeptide repeat protein [bacterium]MBP9810340.1 tetratricopeptide repeat protein [bacterium]
MTAAKLRQLSTLGLALSLALSVTASPVLALAEDIDEVRPHGFTPSEQNNWMRLSRRNRREMPASSPEEAKKMADAMKAGLDAQHQKYTHRQDGFTHTIVVESTKKTVVFKAANPNAAKQELQTAQVLAGLFPKNEQVASLLSRLYESDRNWAKALEYFRKANSLSNSDTLENAVSNLNSPSVAKEALLQGHYAYFELMMKHYETAIKMLTKAIQLQPDSITSYHNRAKAYRALHKNELAEKDEKKMRELAQNENRPSISELSNEGYGTLALLMVEFGSLEEALRMAEATLKKEPNSAAAILAQARANLRLGRYAKALALYKKLETLIKDSGNLKAEMAPAVILAKQGPPPYGDLSAIAAAPQGDAFSQHNRESVGHGGSYDGGHGYGHGHFHNRSNNNRPSFSQFTPPIPPSKLAADHKGDYRVYWAICEGLKEKSLIKPLDTELNKMLTIVPDDTKVIERKIEAAEALRDWTASEKFCNIYLNQLTHGKNGPIKTDFVQYAFAVRALARRAQKNLAGAIEDGTTVIKLAPESALAYRDRGDCYRLSGKYDLAVADYTKAIQLDSSKSSSNYWRRAKAYEKLNNANLAKQDLEMAKKLDAAQSKI